MENLPPGDVRVESIGCQRPRKSLFSTTTLLSGRPRSRLYLNPRSPQPPATMNANNARTAHKHLIILFFHIGYVVYRLLMFKITRYS